MAAPDFVPTTPTDRVRVYTSPPRRPDSWRADRPGDLRGGQPRGDQLGSIGPDQGYAYRLARQFADRLHLGGTHREDAIAGCVAVATKRASLLRRAPVVHDLTAAFTVFGFLDADAPAELVELREHLFVGVHDPHHYVQLRRLVDLVPAEVLRHPHTAIAKQYEAAWRDNLDLDDLAEPEGAT